MDLALVLITRDRWPVLTAALDRLRAGATGAVCTYRHLRKDGSHLWVEDHRRMASPPGGGAPECVGNIRDVTERKSLDPRPTR